MSIVFELPWSNPDLDIHPDPPPPWDRVACACMWSDAKKARARWPHAAVIGPLRTLRGIDLLVRGLLANPQIRVLILDGPDLTPGEETRNAVLALWEGTRSIPVLDTDGTGASWDVLVGVKLVDIDTVEVARALHARATHPSLPPVKLPADEDRPGGCILLPPPPPEAAAAAPHGDPGDRVAGDTLADVWPLVLRQAMRCGRTVPTHYGDTREVLNLVAVVRDPFMAWTDIGSRNTHPPVFPPTPLERPHPTLGITAAQVEDYYQRLVGPEPAEGAAYSYGSRLRGTGGLMIYDAPKVYQENPDQIERAQQLLDDKPDSRAVFLTPWRPDEDSGKESGRPCLVGVWFRAVDGALHMTTTWRSRDLYGAWPLNVAACCRWLCDEADRLDMAVGTLTDISFSAHVYDRDWQAAEAVIDSAKLPAIDWDQRVSFLIEQVRARQEFDDFAEAELGPGDSGAFNPFTGHGHLKPRLRVTALTPDGSEVIATWEDTLPERLRRKVAQSGLIQSVQAAMWLGAEIERVRRLR